MQNKFHFGAGLFLGVVVTAVFLHFFAPRYAVLDSDTGVVKHDKWTGNAWRYDGEKWEKIAEDSRDWKPVDAALMNALNIQEKKNPAGSSSINDRLKALKKKYPVLETVSDEDVMERIKYLYARKIIVDLYLNQMEIK
jgi:hypothetical protein